MKNRGAFPYPAVLLLLGIVLTVRLASRHLPSYLPFQADLLAAALFLYAPLLRYRGRELPAWMRLGEAKRAAVAGIALAAAGTLAYAAYVRLPLPSFLEPPGAGEPFSAARLLPQALLAALPEEVFFRGYLYDAFEESGREPILPSSLLFAAGHLAIHASWYRALTLFPGLVLGGARKWSGNIYVPIFLHLLFNLLPWLAGGARG